MRAETGVISEEFAPIGLILTGRILGLWLPQKIVSYPRDAVPDASDPVLDHTCIPYCTRLSRLTCTC